MKFKKQGFTLIELLTVISIISILLGVGLPNLKSLLIRSEVTSRVNQMTGLLKYAREYSLTKNIVVTICPSSNGKTCSKDWSQGQVVFTDKNLNHINDDEDNILRTAPQLPQNHIMTWRAFQNKKYLQYSPTGFTRYQNGTFRYCVEGTNSEFNRALIITMAGRVRLSKDSDGDGKHEDRKGNEITCRKTNPR